MMSSKYRHVMSDLAGNKVVYNKLVQHNVKFIPMYSGGAIMPLIDNFHSDMNHGKIITHVNTHEQHCGHSATGYAKSTGHTGVTIVTSGPGVTNMITPLQDATSDSTPLILLSGQVPRSAMGSDAFQECPAVECTTPVTKWSFLIHL